MSTFVFKLKPSLGKGRVAASPPPPPFCYAVKMCEFGKRKPKFKK